MIESFVLIIGAMKSGTTTLFDLLASHPEIAPCKTKEPGFFAFPDRWAEGFSWYENLFQFDPRIHKYALDGSTDYTKFPFCDGIVDRLAQSAPRRFKLIYIVRHPLRRIESHACHAQIFGQEVGQCRSPRFDHSLDAGISPVSMQISRYASQLDQYVTYHERKDLLIIAFEDLVNNHTETFQTICNFLQISEIKIPPIISNKSGNKKKNPILWNYIYNIEAINKIIKHTVSKNNRRKFKKVFGQKLDVDGRFILSSSEESKLVDEIEADLINFRDIYGVDIDRLWGGPRLGL